MAICDDIWAIWNMDQAPPGPLTDSSGNAHDLILAAGIQADGIIVNSIAGLGAYVVDDPGTLDLSSDSPFTVSLWWYPAKNTEISEGDDSSVVLEYYPDGNPPAGITLFLNLDTTFLLLEGGISAGDLSIDITPSINVDAGFVDAWHHIAIRYDGTQLELFIDNSLIDSVSGSTNITAPSTVVVEASASSAHPEGGSSRMDDAAIWSRDLTDVELDYIWNLGLANPVVCEDPEPTYTTDSEIQVNVLSYTGYKLIDSSGVCVAPATGCLPLAEMSKNAAPSAGVAQDDAPTASLSASAIPSAAMVCKMILGS